MGEILQAIIEVGGKQYQVKEGARLAVEKISGLPGETLALSPVKAFFDEKESRVGLPREASKIKVLAKILRHGRARKLVVFKKRAKKGYKRTYGHRQAFTEVEITQISKEQ